MDGRDAAALLHHAIRQKLARQDRFIKAALSGQRPGADAGTDAPGAVHMTETRIYVGLNDAESREQKFETQKYLNILKDVCRNYHVAFSVDVEEGGYFHEDGEYTEETSLMLLLIDAEREVVQQIAQDLCAFFHQESVLVTEDQIGGYFVGEETAD